MKVEINRNMVVQIVVQELTEAYNYLKKGKHNPPVFSDDPKEEKRLIAKEMAALRVILKTYGATP